MKIELGDTYYTPFIRTQRVDGKEQVMWEIEKAIVIGIRKSEFEGRWSNEDLSEAFLVKFKMNNEEYCVSEYDLKDPQNSEGFSFFSTVEDADDYAMTMVANDYYDGNIDEDAFIIENRTVYAVLKMIENYEKEQKEEA